MFHPNSYTNLQLVFPISTWKAYTLVKALYNFLKLVFVRKVLAVIVCMNTAHAAPHPRVRAHLNKNQAGMRFPSAWGNKKATRGSGMGTLETPGFPMGEQRPRISTKCSGSLVPLQSLGRPSHPRTSWAAEKTTDEEEHRGVQVLGRSAPESHPMNKGLQANS